VVSGSVSPDKLSHEAEPAVAPLSGTTEKNIAARAIAMLYVQSLSWLVTWRSIPC
jgi:hypothetical protein